MLPQFEMLVQLVTLTALIAGILFGILELRRAAKLRAEKAALDVFNITVQREVMDALTLVLNLPRDAAPDHVQSSADLRRAAELVMNLYEYWGIMVYYRVVPLRTLDLLVGGWCAAHGNGSTRLWNGRETRPTSPCALSGSSGLLTV